MIIFLDLRYIRAGFIIYCLLLLFIIIIQLPGPNHQITVQLQIVLLVLLNRQSAGSLILISWRSAFFYVLRWGQNIQGQILEKGTVCSLLYGHIKYL